MSDQMDVAYAEETSLAAVTDDSHTVHLIELVPLDRASDIYCNIEPVVEVQSEDLQDVKHLSFDDCCKREFVEPVFEVKPEDLQMVNQSAFDNYCKAEFIDPAVEVKLEDLQVLKHLASDDYCKPEFIEPVVEVKPEDLQDVKQEPADDSYSEAAHYSVMVGFF